MGILYIGTILDEWKKNWRTDMKYTIFHEITHVLGFSMSFFPSLNMVKKEGSIYYINSPKVLELGECRWKIKGGAEVRDRIGKRDICLVKI